MENKKINFVSNLDLHTISGGGSSVNVATYTQLKKYFDVDYVGRIHEPFDRLAKFKSNVLTAFKLKGGYHFFSDRRLSRIAKQVEQRLLTASGNINFFHSITPWISYESQVPYYAYTDACFATYVEVFNNKNQFSPNDLNRIYEKEAVWISKAEKIFFRSHWALEETVKHYNVSRKNLEVIGLGGFIPIPEKDVYSGEKYFLFISKEFVPKGGMICLEAFKNLSVKYPEIKFRIIGDAPPKEQLIGWDNIEYIGFLRKENSEEFNQFQNEIANAFALIHPTVKDTNALVITEVGYYGCPSIASNSFAIAEFIQDKKTGLLLDVPLRAADLEQKMEYLLQHENEYQVMRKNVRHFTTENNTWDKVGERLVLHINNR